MAGIQDIQAMITSVMGSGGQLPADLQKLAQPILDMIQQNGGLQQIIGQLQNSPIGEQVNSWLGTGANEAVTPDQVAEAMPNAVEDLAAQTGMSAEQVSTSMSELLPNLIDKLSPGGQLPGADQLGDVLKNLPGGDQLSGMLGGLLGGSK